MVRRLLVSASAIALVTYAWLGFYTRYVADDFCTAAVRKGYGFWGTQAYWRASWSGRYAFYFLSAALQAIGARVVPLLPALAIVVWIAGAIMVSRSLLPLAGIYAVVDGASDVWQSVMWETGMLSYLVPLIVATLWLAAYARRDRRRGEFSQRYVQIRPLDRPSPPGEPAASGSSMSSHNQRVSWMDVVLPLIAGGFAETFTICAITALALACAFAPGRARRPLLVALASSAAALLIVAMAPGNAIRSSYFPPMMPLRQLVTSTAVIAAQFMGVEIAHAAASLALVFITAALFAPTGGDLRRRAALATLLAAGTAVASQLAAIAVMSLRPPARTLIVPHFFVVLAAALLGSCCARWVQGHTRLATFVVVALLLAGPLLSTVTNLRAVPAARAFADSWDAADSKLSHARGQDAVVEAPLLIDGMTFLAPNPDHWVNRCMAGYYGLKSVRNSH